MQLCALCVGWKWLADEDGGNENNKGGIRAREIRAREIRLYNDDCIKKLNDIPNESIDPVLTDPPYGINYKSKQFPKILNDKRPFTEFIPLLREKVKSTGCLMVFTRWDVQQQFIDKLKENDFKVRNVIIWDKQLHGQGNTRSAYGSRYESIIFCSGKEFRFPAKRPVDIVSERKLPSCRMVHPNEKPVGLLETLIRQVTNAGDTVLDCFMGSGTTGMACVNSDRSFTGIELDEGYFNLAQSRIERKVEEKRIYDESLGEGLLF